jgi:hypothetical protein
MERESPLYLKNLLHIPMFSYVVILIKRTLQHPYDGPFEVKYQISKTFRVVIKNKDILVSVDRLKMA